MYDAAGSILNLAGTGLQAFGAIREGEAQAAIARRNADVEAEDARAALDRANLEEDVSRRGTERLRSRQRSLIGASGVTVEGSPLEILTETAEIGALDAAAIRFGGRTQARGALSRRELDLIQASEAKRTALGRAGTSLLTGANKLLRPKKKVKL